MLGTDGVFAILLGAVPVYLFTFLPELLQEKRKSSNTRNGSNTSNISNIGKSYPEILKKQGNGFIRIFALLVYTVEGILLAGYGLFLLSDLMVSELLKNSSFVLAAVLLMLLCGYEIASDGHNIKIYSKRKRVLLWSSTMLQCTRPIATWFPSNQEGSGNPHII